MSRSALSEHTSNCIAGRGGIWCARKGHGRNVQVTMSKGTLSNSYGGVDSPSRHRNTQLLNSWNDGNTLWVFERRNCKKNSNVRRSEEEVYRMGGNSLTDADGVGMPQLLVKSRSISSVEGGRWVRQGPSRPSGGGGGGRRLTSSKLLHSEFLSQVQCDKAE